MSDARAAADNHPVNPQQQDRADGRQHELAVRSALGGRRTRLVMQLLVESTMLSAAGGVAGVLLAVGILEMLIGVAPALRRRNDGESPACESGIAGDYLQMQRRQVVAAARRAGEIAGRASGN